jgi:hypothetical protein
MYGGVALEILEMSVETSEDEFVWLASVAIADTQQYRSIRLDDPITVTVGGVSFSMIVTNKQLDRSDPEKVSMTISCRSPAIGYLAPRAQDITYTLTTAMYAKAVCEDILGVTINWNIVNWVIQPYAFAVVDTSPIAAVQTIAEAVGAMVYSNPDGSISVNYVFPVSVVNFDTTTPDVYLTDSQDNLSYGEEQEPGLVFNAFRIRDWDDGISDSLDFTKDELLDDTGVLRAYVMPWRVVDLQHTGGEAVVALSPWVVESRIETEMVEFTNGTASLKYPAVGITNVVWRSDSLAGVYVTPRTKDLYALDTATNYGYGVADITYVVECYACTVQFPTGKVAQFILKDNG